MSFQGDVAGIGLGELLQGLSRGGRDGVLTLYGDEISSALGLHRGQLYLLAGPDEDEDHWRERSLNAYVEDPNPNIESSRRETIARAARLESMYQLLEAPNLHFRFEPGPLPVPAGFSSQAPKQISLDGTPENEFDPQNSPWGAGLTVEYLLLEHARISDESKSGAAATLSNYDIPRSYDTQAQPDLATRDFLAQCDGTSTLQEISDRLGWPFQQVKNRVGEYVESGHLRMAQPRELLAGAQRELELGRIGRAAVRLTGWIDSSEPGPPPVGDADLLVGEWENGRLGHILHALEARTARALLRKLDRVHLDQRAARDRWRALSEAHKKDELAALHEVALRLVSTDEPEARTFHDLLRLARNFQERGMARRTRTMLRLAAGYIPERPKVRIELGKRMLETGLVEEGTRWLLNTAHQLIESGDPEGALAPIRFVLREVPDNPEANSLQIHAQTQCINRRKRKITAGIGLSIGVLLSLVAFVQYRSYREVEHWLAEIQGYVGRPEQALGMLDQAFGEEPPPRILEARQRLLALKIEAERREYEKWHEIYTQAEDACRFGDPLLGLHRTLALEKPPTADPKSKSFPERQDLLGVLAARLGDRAEELDLPATAPLDELNQEQRLIDLLDEIVSQFDPETSPPEVASFLFRTTELHGEILERRELRAEERAVLSAQEKDEQADILLATARAHAAAGDLARSLAAYDRLIVSDPTLRDLPLLATEIEEVRLHFEGVEAAIAYAQEGEHDAAADALLEVCPRPLEHLLPFRVESRPSGVRVTMPNGRVRTTPFVAKSGVGELVQLDFSSPGFRSRTVQIDRPRDVMVSIHKLPERSWETEHRIEAVPVPAGDDHVIADRFGNIRRLSSDSKTRWQRDLHTLGGVARTPMFLPGKPGHLLVLSEDGMAWLVNAGTGEIAGPREIGSPPVEGPLLTRGGVTAAFQDKRVGVWTDSIEPIFYQDESLVKMRGEDGENTGSLVVLRRSLGNEESLTSPWNDWCIEVVEEAFLVTAPDGRGFTAERKGEWTYLAWEAPKAFVPHGRVWVSDEAGLRAYLPKLDELVVYPETYRDRENERPGR